MEDYVGTSPPPDASDEGLAALSAHCQDLLGSLPRSDQRRASEAYVAGLLQCPGRKSIRRIADASTHGLSDQSLQQFVNQSRWDPAPVRQRLAGWLTDRSAPTAWVVGEVAFAKNGRHSAAVGRQFSRSTGRLLNCQVGVFVALATEDALVPVTWRLCIPRSWDDDELRRRKAHIPADERHRPYWRYQLEGIDDLSGDWGVPLAPVVLDQRQSSSVGELLHELDERALPYVVRVSSTVPGRDAITGMASLPRRTVSWRDAVTGRQVRAQFTCAPVRPAVADDDTGRRTAAPRLLVLEWGLGKRTPRAAWLCSTADRDLGELVALTRLPRRARVTTTTMTERLGLCDYEGRSFIGWHHHVTLASVAYAFHVSTSAGAGRTASASADLDPLHPPPTPDEPRSTSHDPDQHRRPGLPGAAGQPARQR